MRFFATAARGTEPALRDELRELRFRGVRAERGGVAFDGDLREGLRACLWSAVAMRVLLPVGELEAPSGDALYEGIRALDVTPYLGARTTLAVRAHAQQSALSHTQFIAQRTKDALVDPLRERLGVRPDVDRDDPDVRFFVHLARDRAKLYVDLSGEPLHLRGYRVAMLDAPLKETLGAAIVRLTGWDRASPFHDPMCGTGTLAIEAALLAQGIAPGHRIRRFGAERWAGLGPEAQSLAHGLREEARARRRSGGPEILASDADPRAVAATEQNAQAAGVTVRVSPRHFHDLEPSTTPRTLAMNPPYGVRIAGEEGLYAAMARVFARERSSTIALLAGNEAVARALPRRPDRWYALWNGDIECRLFLLEAAR